MIHKFTLIVILNRAIHTPAFILHTTHRTSFIQNSIFPINFMMQPAFPSPLTLRILTTHLCFLSRTLLHPQLQTILQAFLIAILWPLILKPPNLLLNHLLPLRQGRHQLLLPDLILEQPAPILIILVHLQLVAPLQLEQCQLHLDLRLWKKRLILPAHEGGRCQQDGQKSED